MKKKVSIYYGNVLFFILSELYME